MKKNIEEIINQGDKFGQGLREASSYEKTQAALLVNGLIEAVLNQTPPVGLNLRILLEQMPGAVRCLQDNLPTEPVCSIFGLAIVDGITDLAKTLSSVGKKTWSTLNVVDIDSEMIDRVLALRQSQISALHEDARETTLSTVTQDWVIRDHLGNCCPPEIYSAVEKEVARVLKPNGLSLVNITTNEDLLSSSNRVALSLTELTRLLGDEVLLALREKIFSLSELKKEFPTIDVEILRGRILEIAPDSYVVFGEDEIGHGEWFSSFKWQEKLWQENGFTVLGHHIRHGEDSHLPPLQCVRHIVLLQKNITQGES